MQNGMTLANLARIVACVAIVGTLSAGRAEAGRFVRATTMKKAQPAAAAQPAAPAAAPAAPAAAPTQPAAPAKAPAAPATPPTKAAKPAPAPAPKANCAPQKACCPAPCISYVDRSCRPCCDNRPPVKTVLKVVNPCTCCTVDVPVCLPACCEGTPSVCARCGIILCRSVVTYDWCCGYRVVVRFNACGDVTVVYRG